MSQREIAAAMGISLGRVNYCVRALVERGLVNARNFQNSSDRRKYSYLLTPRGIEAKASLTLRFLKRKLEEHSALESEIAQLRKDALVLTQGKR